MINDIKYIPGFANAELVNKLSEYAKMHDSEFYDYGNIEKEFRVHTYHEIYHNDQDMLEEFQQLARKVYNFVNNNYDGEFQEFLETKTHIARFEPGKGMHEHFDSSRPNDIATLIYLNNDYLGGEIYFPEYQMSFKPEPGDLLCFPDNPNFIHGVKPITSGIRYTTPRWFTRIV